MPSREHPTTVTRTPAAASVYLVDDHAMIRASLRLLLTRAGGFEVVGDTGDPLSCVEQIGELRPRIVLLDITMPGLSGIDLVPKIRAVHPDVRIVMVSHLGGQSTIDRCLAAGADAFVSKDAPLEHLIETMRATLQGEHRVVPPDRNAGAPAPGALATLTAREREILQLLVLGHTNKEVGRQLAVSVSTVKKHRENLQRKLGCSSAAELVRLAVREGLIDP
jgi:DNA-binding NarL/FixJ family response regulator